MLSRRPPRSSKTIAYLCFDAFKTTSLASFQHLSITTFLAFLCSDLTLLRVLSLYLHLFGYLL
jgi:hypothetical protein